MTDLNTPGAQQAIHHPRWYRLGRILDIGLNVALLNGSDAETISLNLARRRAEGARYAACGCWLLSIIVERNHCDRVLSPDQIAMPAAIRAGAAMLVLLGLLTWLGHMIPRWLF